MRMSFTIERWAVDPADFTQEGDIEIKRLMKDHDAKVLKNKTGQKIDIELSGNEELITELKKFISYGFVEHHKKVYPDQPEVYYEYEIS